MDLQIKPLSPELLDDYLYFFDNMTFKDHPHWSACYCYSFHFSGEDKDWSRERNRTAVTERILKSLMQGYLVFSEGKVVGWCNVNDKLNYKALSRWHPEIESSQEKTLAIVCFLIHPSFRGKGIAAKILQRIISDCENNDFKYIEAYPGKDINNSEGHYKGPLNMYTKQGFSIVEEFTEFYIVKKGCG